MGLRLKAKTPVVASLPGWLVSIPIRKLLRKDTRVKNNTINPAIQQSAPPRKQARTQRSAGFLQHSDGEEALQRWSYTDGLYGSRHFAHELSAQGTLNQVRALILVDMIADAHLDIHREAHSTPWLSDIVFAQARRLGYGRCFLNSPWPIEDDHIPFLELGMPAVDIIDFDYGPFNLYWHTRYDTRSQM